MYDPHENKFVPIEDDSKLTPEQRGWAKFREDEKVNINGVVFRIHEIGESRIVLKPVDKQSWKR